IPPLQPDARPGVGDVPEGYHVIPTQQAQRALLTSDLNAWAWQPSGEQRAVVVELDHPHRPVRRGVEAQAAEHALVEVLLHDLEPVAVALGVDVDGAGFAEPGRKFGVGRGSVVDLHGDEGPLPPHDVRAPAATPAIFALIISGMSSIRSATAIPASARRAIFS